METVLSSPVAADAVAPMADFERKALRLLVLKLSVLPVWLVLGGFLAWLVHDFGRSAGFGQERFASFLIMAMFVISTALISMVSVAAYRASRSQTQLGIDR